MPLPFGSVTPLLQPDHFKSHGYGPDISWHLKDLTKYSMQDRRNTWQESISPNCSCRFRSYAWCILCNPFLSDQFTCFAILNSTPYRTRKRSHHPHSWVYCVCWGFLHSQLHCSVRLPSCSEVDRSAWEPSEWQWNNSGWANVPWQQNLCVTEISFSTYIPSWAVHLSIHCEFSSVS